MFHQTRKLILASASPRRQYLLKEIGLTFTVDPPHIDESFPGDMPAENVPSYLAEKKAKALLFKITDEIVVASDTVVILKNKILNKPQDRNEAIEMLSRLSGNTHTVITAVCLLSQEKCECFDDRTEVTFKTLSKEEIEFYVDHYKPYDKAGAYGAQDFIGMVAIEKIVGSYFTVMGLPVHQVYARLQSF
ncbi:MAG: Septum formation protein Maf [Cytophagales bacterium]|jgi:septum formation protein|nr:septum formation protein Maf [Bacteroidota bacterium]MBS1982201.1 septum formation protein Maf [Bacteroidota bacterium]WHZ09511.1 MAG: Septum formation protein Maf [Cytophagales bacterium]